MYISGFDLEKHETVLVNSLYVIRVHKFQDNLWPVLETLDGRSYEINEEEEIQKVAQFINAGVQKPAWETVSIEKIKLSNRTQNLLRRNNIRTIQHILDRGRKGIMSIHGMGKTSFDEIEDRISELGAEWK